MVLCRDDVEGDQVEMLLPEIMAMREHHNAAEQKVEMVGTENAVLRRMADGLRNAIDTLRKELDGSQKALKDARARIASLEEQLARQSEQMQGLYARLGGAERVAQHERFRSEKLIMELDKLRRLFKD